MVSAERPRADELSEEEREALHEIELGVERLHRAHGQLVAFHHDTGRAMDHLAVGEQLLRENGYEDLADELRDEYLPRGVVTRDDPDDVTAGRWSYEILEDFQDVFLDDVLAFCGDVHERVAGGLRHAYERSQEREWKRRARRE